MITIREAQITAGGYKSNNLQTVVTEVGEFSVEQRNAGFASNDGRWSVHQYADLYWSSIGILTERRPSKFLGVFDTIADVIVAIEAAKVQPEHIPYHIPCDGRRRR